MTKVLIIEDELLAQAKLESMLKAIDPTLEVMAKLGSVKESLAWLSKNNAPDIAFIDIQLSDDHSFEIFRHIDIKFPVVFTTAYDKYLLNSFEHNAIDYLLKPINEEKLKRSLDKHNKFKQHFTKETLESLLSPEKQKDADRIVLKKGTEFIALSTTDIAYCFTEHRIVFVRDFGGRQFIADKNLSEIESILDEKNFFRINRKYIVNVSAIEKFKPDNGKIKIFLKPKVNDDIHVSKETAPLFRKWVKNENGINQ